MADYIKKTTGAYTGKTFVIGTKNVAEKHPEYDAMAKDWDRVRDSMRSESWIHTLEEKYLPRPAGMSEEYASAYDAYLERAHYPQISPYALSGALGVIITKLPEFNVPKKMEYIKKTATKEGDSLKKLFLDTITEILQTSRCPLLVDIIPNKNQFRFVRYKAEAFINWKENVRDSDRHLILSVLQENAPATNNLLSHDYVDIYRVLSLDAKGRYVSRVYEENGEELTKLSSMPKYMGSFIKKIPLFIAGSVTNGVSMQPIPLLPVANCAVDIYRKEADLANSEFLSCNPTLCITGASNDDNIPNVVGSSVLIVLPDPQSRVFYTTTDTAALSHVKEHIDDLYEEAIRHGVAILDSRKGVESAEALRIRQATQAASIYSIYLSAVNAILEGLKLMAEWCGEDPEKVNADIPSSLTFGVPDANVIREVVMGFGVSTIPLRVVYKYLISSGLVESSMSYDEYTNELIDNKKLRDKLGITQEQVKQAAGMNPPAKSNSSDTKSED